MVRRMKWAEPMLYLSTYTSTSTEGNRSSPTHLMPDSLQYANNIDPIVLSFALTITIKTLGNRYLRFRTTQQSRIGSHQSSSFPFTTHILIPIQFKHPSRYILSTYHIERIPLASFQILYHPLHICPSFP